MLLPIILCTAVLIPSLANCASINAISGNKNDVFQTSDDDDIKIFAGASSSSSSDEKKSIITDLYEPFYYVSRDLYDNVCTNERCNDVADLFLSSVGKSVKPCDDFHAYACGKKRNDVYTTFKEIKDILEQRSIDKNDQTRTKSLTLERKFYRSCMEQRETDKKTNHEFLKLMDLSNGLSLFRSDIKSRTVSWQSIDGLYASLGFDHAFFNVRVVRDPDDERSQANVIALTPPSAISFHSFDRFLKHKNLTDVVYNLFGDFDKANLRTTDYDDVMEFNDALSEILSSIGALGESAADLVKNKITFDKWQKMYDSNSMNDNQSNHINWFKTVNTLLKTVNLRIDKSEQILIKKIDYFTKLNRLLGKTSQITIEKYIHIKFIAQIGKYLNSKMARILSNDRDRSTFCIKQFDNQLVGATYEYIKRHVPREQKFYAEKIANDVKNVLTVLIPNAKWMDEETKYYAIEKLKNLKITMGYPNWQTNLTLVNSYYGNNVIKFKRRSLIHEFEGVRFPYLYDPLTMSKQPTPLIYNFEINNYIDHIFFPADYLNEKKFKLLSPDLPSSINYGSFGSMLGSILYDYVSLTDNLMFDEFYTRTSDGFSKNTIEAYKIEEKCLSSQLGRYKKTKSTLNQHLSSVIDSDTIQVDKIYEKITGLRAAFEAYKKFSRNDDEEHLPGFEHMNSNQMFFLSYAKRICEIGDIYDEYDAYETSLKVNGVVSNLKDFSDVFNCSSRREAKCELFG